MRVLVVNAGSSSLKISVIGQEEETIAAASVAHGDTDALTQFTAAHAPLDASGHRIVHGGQDFSAPAVIDEEVIARLEALVPLAPLHQQVALDGVRTTMRALPGVPAVACFDTAFHATLDRAASTYAIPAAWRQRWGLRRFGFHGLSHQWASRRAIEMTGRAEAGSRVVTCHLGAGASLCAVRAGRSVDTTMGFTPLEGLVMNTRSGTVDPGMILWLIRRAGVDPAEVEEALDRRSGLAALSGTDGDTRHVMAAAAAGDDGAQLAIAVWVHRLRQSIGAMAATLGGVDVLVFTGGIGEHEPLLRAETAAGLGFLGVALDAGANATATADADVSATEAGCRTVVVTAREDRQIARLVRERLG
jgi:acetate kinase